MPPSGSYFGGPFKKVGDTFVSSSPISAPNINPTDARNRVALFGNSIGVDSYFPTWKLNASDPVNGLGPWGPYLSVTVGKIVHPISLDLRNGVIPLSFQCTTAGTTGAVEPTAWPSVVGDTVVDGTAVWTAISDRTAFYWHLGGWTLAQAMSGQKFDEVYMVGASGQNSPAILAYRDRAVATGVNAMAYLHMWENDVKGPGVTLEIMQARFATFRNYVLDDLANGRLVILGTCLPMSTIDSTSSFTGYSAGTETKKWHWVNAEIRKLALMKGVYLADFSESYIDPNWANPVYPDNVTTFVKGSGSPNKYTMDGIHPFLAGHFAISKILAKTLDAIPLPKYEFSIHGAYQTLSINPLHYGTGGTGANVAGSIADKRGWIATIAGATASLEQRTDGINGKWQRVQGAFSASSTLYGYSSETAVIPADMLTVPVQGLYEVKIAANPTGLQEVLFGITAPGKGATAFSGSSPTVSQMLGQFLTSDYTLLLKTPPMSLPSNATDMTIYPVISTSGASGIYDIRLGRNEIRRAAR